MPREYGVKGLTEKFTNYKSEDAALHLKAMSQDLTKILEVMSVKQRSLFVSKIKGLDDLKAMIDCGAYYKEICGIVKIVYMVNNDGSAKSTPFPANKITLSNVDKLDSASYERLLRIAKSCVANTFINYTVDELIVDAQPLLRMLIPDAIGTLAHIVTNKLSKDDDRIKAANSLLDRAGVVSKDQKTNVMMPFQININFDGKPKAEEIIVMDHGKDISGND